MPETSNLKGVFKNRKDALIKLLDIMPVSQMQKQDFIVVAISPRGIIFAYDIAKALNAPFDFLFTEYIPAPNNQECNLAVVSETKEIVVQDELLNSFEIKIDYIYGEAMRRFEERILKNVYKYRKGETISSLEGRNVLLVDEGIDSGLTAMVSIKSAHAQKAKTICLATPVIPFNVGEVIEGVTDECYYLYKPQDFVDTAYYYEEFYEQATSEIEKILNTIIKGNIIKKG